MTFHYLFLFMLSTNFLTFCLFYLFLLLCTTPKSKSLTTNFFLITTCILLYIQLVLIILIVILRYIYLLPNNFTTLHICFLWIKAGQYFFQKEWLLNIQDYAAESFFGNFYFLFQNSTIQFLNIFLRIRILKYTFICVSLTCGALLFV